MRSIPHPARPRTPFPPYTTDRIDRLIQVTQCLLTMAHATHGMARLLAEALDRVYSGVMDERERCTCGQHTRMEG